MAINSFQYQAFRASFDRLVNTLKSDVETVARKAFERNLISMENKGIAENPTTSQEFRASKLLDQILSKIEEKESHFDIFISILESVPVLKDLAVDLKKAVSDLQQPEEQKDVESEPCPKTFSAEHVPIPPKKDHDKSQNSSHQLVDQKATAVRSAGGFIFVNVVLLCVSGFQYE